VKVHPHKLEPRTRNQVEILFLAGYKVNVHPDSHRQDWFRDFGSVTQQRKHTY
jgi:hypothetical protein